MSSVEAPRAAGSGVGPAVTEALLTGWGRTSPSGARVVCPATVQQLAELVCGAPAGGLIARGAGRSYGDPAQNADGTVLDTSRLVGVQALEHDRREVRVAAGTSFEQLLGYLADHGLTLPVVPGTRHLTVGGAIASDVHGKNHPAAGSIARQLSSFTLCTPSDGPIEVSAQSAPDLFEATLGGMGLTGVVAAATLRTIPMREPYALADVDRVDSLEAAIALMRDGSHSHSIAWLDLLAPGAAFARGVVTRSHEGSQPAEPGALRTAPRPRLRVPAKVPGGLLRPSTIRLFNAAVWLRSRRRVRGRPLGIAQQLFPLDRVSDWNRLYGPAGLLQYQFAVPTGSEAALRTVLELLRRERLGMYLAALKRFGPGSGGMLSFPIEGWTLAVDLPAGTPGVRAALDRADDVVTSVGGRVYLAKDARMRPEALPAMYQRLPRFIEVRAEVDPDGVLRSDLGRRLGLSG